MTDVVDLSWLTSASHWLEGVVAARIQDPLFWLQFGIIAVNFVIARWLLTPLFRAGMTRLARASTRVPAFQRPLVALSRMATPATWLGLQWLATGLADARELPSGALTVATSLLAAWLLIRLASLLVANTLVARVVALFAWSVAALNIFGLLEPVMTLLDGWALTLGEIRLSPLTVLKIVMALALALWLANGLASMVERRLDRAEAVAPAMRVLGGKLTRIGLFATAVLVAVSAVGIDLTALAVFGGALGVGLGFGLQKIFSNLVSGVMLLMDRSIKPGDVIAVGDTFGWINYLGARYASVITRDGIEHLIPNEEMITQRVENWSYSHQLVRLKIPIGISYRSDPRKALALCVEAAEAVPRVKDQPEPRCQLRGFGDSSIELELRVWIDDPSNGRANVISEVLLEVWDRFHEHGVEIPFPQRDLHLRSALGERELRELAAILGARTAGGD